MRRSRLLIIVAAMIALSSCQSDTESKKGDAQRGGSTSAAGDGQPNFSTLTPYPEPTSNDLLEAPDGFEPVFAQFVARHGARSLTDNELLADTIALWEQAKDAGALTAAGERFGPDARKLQAAMRKVGFGELSTLGKEEMQGIGARAGERLSSMFDAAIADGARVDLFDSGKSRARASARNFARGLRSTRADLEIEPSDTDEKVLKFDSENNEYEDFLEDGPWKSAYNQLRRKSGIDQAAGATLRHLYTPEFVNGIDKKLYYANGVFDVFRSGPSMSRDVEVDTTAVMPPEAAAAFVYVDDGRFFYSRGPGLEGDDGSYQAAQILLDSFFEVIDDRLQDRGDHPHAAVYRFAHAEEMSPFASLLELPGADQQAKPGELYTHENNDYKVSTVTPLSANIEWVVWGDGDTHLVSVSHNEVPTTVGRDCRLYEDTENFYELEELRTCLGATG